jgi:hypothetical protein
MWRAVAAGRHDGVRGDPEIDPVAVAQQPVDADAMPQQHGDVRLVAVVKAVRVRILLR